MAKASKEALLKKRLPTKTVTVAGVGDVVVRGLSRAEVLAVQVAAGDDPTARDVEAHTLAVALVDPQLTVDEIREWQAASPAGEMEELTRVVSALCKVSADAPKEAYKSVRR